MFKKLMLCTVLFGLSMVFACPMGAQEPGLLSKACAVMGNHPYATIAAAGTAVIAGIVAVGKAAEKYNKKIEDWLKDQPFAVGLVVGGSHALFQDLIYAGVCELGHFLTLGAFQNSKKKVGSK